MHIDISRHKASRVTESVPIWLRDQSPLVRWPLKIFMIVLAVMMILPFLYVLSTSFASFQDTTRSGILLISTSDARGL